MSRSVTPMTEEARVLAAKDVNLARWYAGTQTKHFGKDYDESLSDSSFALCRAAASFKPEMGYQLSTLARACMDRQRLNSHRNSKLLGFRTAGPDATPTITSLDAPIGDEGNLHQLISKECEVDCDIDIGRTLACLDARSRKVVLGHLHGRTFEHIGKELGVKHQRVGQIYHRAIKKLRDRYLTPESLPDRPATKRRGKPNETGRSGIRHQKKNGRPLGTFAARIMVDGVRVNLGTFRTAEQAARAYDAAAIEAGYPPDRLNFPEQAVARVPAAIEPSTPEPATIAPDEEPTVNTAAPATAPESAPKNQAALALMAEANALYQVAELLAALSPKAAKRILASLAEAFADVD